MLGEVRTGWMQEANITCVASCEIDGRGVWKYLIQSPIGDIHIIQYEEHPDPALVTKVFYYEDAKAEKYYKTICRKMVNGTI